MMSDEEFDSSSGVESIEVEREHWLFKMWSWFVSAVSGEWLLTECGYANGGSVIAARSLMSSLGLLCLALTLVNLLDPSRTWVFSWAEARTQLCEKTNWFGTVFAVVYAAFYARFASQWTYLAAVYNQIKAAESTKKCDPLKLAEWKQGFIADAETLHLDNKALFADLIAAWRRLPEVQEAEERIKSEPRAAGRSESSRDAG